MFIRCAEDRGVEQTSAEQLGQFGVVSRLDFFLVRLSTTRQEMVERPR